MASLIVAHASRSYRITLIVSAKERVSVFAEINPATYRYHFYYHHNYLSKLNMSFTMQFQNVRSRSCLMCSDSSGDSENDSDR